MEQSNVNLENTLNKALEQYTTSVDFKSVWSESSKQTVYKRKWKPITLAAALTVIMLFTVGFTYNVFRNVDKTDYPFVEDPNIKGRWETVDFVDKIEDFNPESKNYSGDKFLTAFTFSDGGKMFISLENSDLVYTPFSWTKGMVLSEQDKTASKYEIKEINGTEYMFVEWKDGGYVFRNEVPKLYVLKKVDSEDYSNYQVKVVKQDKIDYPFVDDAMMKGEWESVDFVTNIETFKPGEKSWPGDLFLIKLNLSDNGKVSGATLQSSNLGNAFNWTKGLILNTVDKTAGRCEIKEIDGDTYMFFEWKNGDYVYRGVTPSYYVLKKKN